MPKELYAVSLLFSLVAIGISATTAWFTFFRKGELKATQPTTIFFGPDGLDNPLIEAKNNKVYLRTLLYSTSKLGHVVESLYISLKRNESHQNFNIWVYGEPGALKRGSGLFVPQEGITFDHHFLLPSDGADFNFLAGDYDITLFAILVGNERKEKLIQVKVTVSETLAQQLSLPKTCANFDWGADSKQYHAHFRTFHAPKE